MLVGAAFAVLAPKLTHANLEAFYARHPMRVLGLLERGGRALFAARPGYLGSYPASADHGPGARDCRVCVLSTVLPNLDGPLSLVLFTALLLAIGVVGWRTLRGDHARYPRQPAVAALLSAGFAAVQLPTAVLMAGVEDTKHLVLAEYTLGLALVFTAACVLGRVLTAG